MSLSSFFLFIIGLILLVAGAEALVRGASRLAAIIGISPLVIGLTVVAFGTSSPELAVSVLSGLEGKADISLGNVVGITLHHISPSPPNYPPTFFLPHLWGVWGPLPHPPDMERGGRGCG